MAKKKENIINLLKDLGYPVDIHDSSSKVIAKYVRWAKRSMPELYYHHVGTGVYLVDPDSFAAAFQKLMEYRKEQTAAKSESMKELNKKLKEEKASGLRDNRGKLISQEVESDDDSVSTRKVRRKKANVDKAKEEAALAKANEAKAKNESPPATKTKSASKVAPKKQKTGDKTTEVETKKVSKEPDDVQELPIEVKEDLKEDTDGE